MQLELDHFFILADAPSQQAELLIELGLEESYCREHPGQGTSNHCFKFSNTMLELLWLRDEEEAHNGPGANLCLPQRLNNEQASPFGFIFKRKVKSDVGFPFSGWSYQPDYFPRPMAFHVAENSNDLVEPLLIYVPFMDPVEFSIEPGRFQSVSHVVVHVAIKDVESGLSDSVAVANSVEGLTIKVGEEHLMEVFFSSDNSQTISKDFRPLLPLIFHG